MNDIKAFLLEKDGRSLKVQNEVVTSSVQATALPDLPDGLTDVSIGWERNMDKVGLTRNFTDKLKFFDDAATILTKEFYRTNIEREIFLLLTILTLKINTLTYKWRYDYLYKGELDFSTFSASESGVEIAVMEGGLSKYLSANSGTKYEFPLDDAEADTVTLDGVELDMVHNFLVPYNGASFTELMGISFLTKEGEAAGFASFTVFKQMLPASFADSPDYFCTTTQEIKGLHLTGTIKAAAINGVEFSIYIKNQNGTKVATLLPLKIGDSTTHEYAIDVTFDAAEGDKFFLISECSFFAVYEETKLSIAIKSRYRTTECKAFKPSVLFRKLCEKMTSRDKVSASTLLTQFDHIMISCGDAVRGIKEAAIKTTFNDFFTFCKYLMGAGMGIENDKIVIESYEHFLGYSNPIPLTEIRNFKHSDARDLQANSLEVGYAAKDTDDVNGKFAFNNTYTYSSPVTKVEKKLSYIVPYAADPYYIELTRINLDGKTTTDNNSDNDVMLLDVDAANSVSVSFQAQKSTAQNYTAPADLNYETFTGGFFTPDAGNALLTYTGAASPLAVTLGIAATKSGAPAFVDVTIYKNSEVVVTERVASQNVTTIIQANTTIKKGDTIRIHLSPEGTTDYTVHSSFLVLGLKGISRYKLNRPPYSSISGVPNPGSIFNTELSPKHIMEQQRKWLDSVFFGFQGQKLKFETTDKNRELKTTLNGVTYDEDADYAIGTNRLFKTVIFEMEAVAPENLINLLEANPNRCFSFERNGYTFKGFNLNSGIAPANKKIQTYKLLCTPDTDLSKL